MGVAHHVTQLETYIFGYFNNENDKMTIKKRCHETSCGAYDLMYNLDVIAVGDDSCFAIINYITMNEI